MFGKAKVVHASRARPNSGYWRKVGAAAFLFRTIIYGLLLCAGLSVVSAETFRFRYRVGEQYRILSEIEQDVYTNREFSYSAELLNKIQVKVIDVSEGSGRTETFYQQSEEVQSGLREAYQFSSENTADFWQDEFGVYDIDDTYFVPQVRDVPVFPQHDLSPGDTWTALGREVYDFRENFALPEAYSFTMPVSYRYVGPVRKDGLNLHHIAIQYNIFHQVAIRNHFGVYPQRITGFSNQNLYFDNVLGRSHSYEEEYEIILDLSNGSRGRFTGTARAEVIESEELDRAAIQREVEERLADLGVKDSSVLSDELGVVIALENIQFLPDSTELLASEQVKIDKIAQILAEYPERDILVSGHAALAGSAANRLRISRDRARAVVEYLLAIDARDRARITYQGFGGKRPIASNLTEAGRRRNRRVEITILEN